jgi:hypothetical protein
MISATHLTRLSFILFLGLGSTLAWADSWKMAEPKAQEGLCEIKLVREASPQSAFLTFKSASSEDCLKVSAESLSLTYVNGPAERRERGIGPKP